MFLVEEKQLNMLPRSRSSHNSDRKGQRLDVMIYDRLLSVFA